MTKILLHRLVKDVVSDCISYDLSSPRTRTWYRVVLTLWMLSYFNWLVMINFRLAIVPKSSSITRQSCMTRHRFLLTWDIFASPRGDKLYINFIVIVLKSNLLLGSRVSTFTFMTKLGHCNFLHSLNDDLQIPLNLKDLNPIFTWHSKTMLRGIATIIDISFCY